MTEKGEREGTNRGKNRVCTVQNWHPLFERYIVLPWSALLFTWTINWRVVLFLSLFWSFIRFRLIIRSVSHTTAHTSLFLRSNHCTRSNDPSELSFSFRSLIYVWVCSIENWELYPICFLSRRFSPIILCSKQHNYKSGILCYVCYFSSSFTRH